MNVASVGLIIAAIAFVVFVGVIIYQTSRIDDSTVDESSEWLGVADNEGD